jgi:hypothetical protein
LRWAGLREDLHHRRHLPIFEFQPAFRKPFQLFPAFAIDFPRFHQQRGQAFGDFLLVELSFATAVGTCSPTALEPNQWPIGSPS